MAGFNWALPRGSYWLVGDHPALSDITTQLVVSRSWPWQGEDRRVIQLVFGFDPGQPCRGAGSRSSRARPRQAPR